eukprot:5064443-Amphidinium_carterae.2
MSVKLPMPTQFDGRNPQIREWSGEVEGQLEAFLTMATSVDTIELWNIQDAYVTEDMQYRDNKYPIMPPEDEAEEQRITMR